VKSYGEKMRIRNPFSYKTIESSESPYFEFLGKTVALYECIDLLLADSAYLSRRNCSLEATPRIYPKRGITLAEAAQEARSFRGVCCYNLKHLKEITTTKTWNA